MSRSEIKKLKRQLKNAYKRIDIEKEKGDREQESKQKEAEKDLQKYLTSE